MTSTEAHTFYNRVDPARWGREHDPGSWRIAQRWFEAAVLDPNGLMLELGCGKGPVRTITRRYAGLDLSLPALATMTDPFSRVCADMEQLPIRSESIEYLVSFAAIEHVPNPDRVLEEVCRVLRPGGVAVLAPAWHCRSWAAEGLEFRSYEDLLFRQRVRKRLLPLRNSVLWRAFFEAPVRLWREFRRLHGSPLAFDFRRLTPNLEEYVGTDCDAFTSMDPHAAILYFETRSWEVLSHPDWRSRVFSRSEPVVVRKPRVTVPAAG